MSKQPGEFTTMVDGRITDVPMHEEILNNPEADAAISKRAIERAVADGMSREDAVRLYGIQEEG